MGALSGRTALVTGGGRGSAGRSRSGWGGTARGWPCITGATRRRPRTRSRRSRPRGPGLHHPGRTGDDRRRRGTVDRVRRPGRGPGHPGQQRRDQQGRRRNTQGHRRADGRGFRPPLRGQHQGAVLHRPGGADPSAGRRADHQPLDGADAWRGQARADRLRHVQGSGQCVHLDPRQDPGPARDHGQRGGAGGGEHRYERGLAARRGQCRGAERVKGISPLGRIAGPTEIGDVVAFLASDDSRWVTGQWIDATGGALL